MSSSDGEDQKTRYEFKGKFGEVKLVSYPIEDAPPFEVDAFVRDILGLTKNKGTEPNNSPTDFRQRNPPTDK
jgi:hypothetical protein